MNIKLKIVGIILIILTLYLSGCNENIFKSDKEKIIGTWVYATTLNESTVYVYYIFSTNQTIEIIFLYTGEDIRANGTWNITNNKLIISLEEENIVSDYSFSNNDKTLTLIENNGIKSIFTKQ